MKRIESRKSESGTRDRYSGYGIWVEFIDSCWCVSGVFKVHLKPPKCLEVWRNIVAVACFFYDQPAECRAIRADAVEALLAL